MATIKLRRGPSGEWTTINPILAQGEVGIELDTYRFKIGTGLAQWSTLDYFVAGGATQQELAQMIQDHVDDPNAHPQYITSTELQAHVDDPNAHPQYLSDADLQAHIDNPEAHPLYSTNDEVNLMFQNHMTEMDPHPQYEFRGAGGGGGGGAPSGDIILEGTWNYNATNFTGPPVSGQVRFDNANPGIATTMFLSEFDRNGTSRAPEMDIAQTIPGSTLLVRDTIGAVAKFVIPDVGVDMGAWRQTVIEPVAGNATTLRSQVWITIVSPKTGSGSDTNRSVASLATESLAAGETALGYVYLGDAYRLYKIATNAPARTRLYTTDAHRAADADRPIGTDPTLDHGLILEFISDATLFGVDLSPMVDGFDGELSNDGLIPYAVTNTGAASTAISVEFTFIRTEG